MIENNYENFEIEFSDGIARVLFNTKAGRNALNLEMCNEFISLTTTIGETSDVRCVVLTHEGDFYGTGADLNPLNGDESDASYLRQLTGRLHDAINQLHQAETPIIGGIDGVAAGAGFGMAILPDIVLASEDARFVYAYPNIGLTGDGGSTFWLPRMVGLRNAKEIAMLNEPIEAERAVELGLANEVVPREDFDDRLDELAQQVANGPTHALGVTRRLLTESFNHSLEEQLSAETESIANASQTEDYERGIDAFFGDGDPEFTGK